MSTHLSAAKIVNAIIMLTLKRRLPPVESEAT